MDKRFVKRILKATEDLDTLVYLSSPSFEVAVSKWLKDFGKALDDVVKAYDSLLVARETASFEDKLLERRYKAFLESLEKYVYAIDEVLARRALQYAKIAMKLNGPKVLTVKVLEDIQEANQYLEDLRRNIDKVRKFSQKQMVIAREHKLTRIDKYEYVFNRLMLFEVLTLEKVINLLKENAEV